jgi:hypothetical protein
LNGGFVAIVALETTILGQMSSKSSLSVMSTIGIATLDDSINHLQEYMISVRTKELKVKFGLG